jgi:hypothetical protein
LGSSYWYWEIVFLLLPGLLEWTIFTSNMAFPTGFLITVTMLYYREIISYFSMKEGIKRLCSAKTNVTTVE